MKKYGLIGFPLKHSFSKKYFTEKFEREGLEAHQYELFEIESIDQLKQVLEENTDLVGLNVTIPYKEKVIPYLDELEAGCRTIGAVNTIKVAAGKLIGYNTDYIGFKQSLQTWLENEPIKALVLGTGGASRAVHQALRDLDIPFLSVSRNKGEKAGTLDYQELGENESILNEHLLIINTTPLGTFPAIEQMPEIPLQWITNKHKVYDLVYNPEKTRLMREVEKKGGVIKNGLEMLHLQAEGSWEIWNKNVR